jgi:tRNA(Ile)-lysidine synthase
MLICKEVESAWDELVAESTADKVVLNSKPLSRQCQAAQIEAVRRGLVEIGSGERDLTEYHYKRIIALAKSGSGKRIELPGGFSAASDYGKIVLQRQCGQKLKAAEEPLVLEIPGKGRFGGYAVEAKLLDAKNCDIVKFKAEKDNFVEWFDSDRLRGPLTIRRRKAGDKFWPLGLGREKKIGKFLTAERLSSKLRDEIIVISDSEKIIWLGPLRPSELTKITDQTSGIVEIRANRTS